MNIVFDLDGVILDIDDLKKQFPEVANYDLYNYLTEYAKPIQKTVNFIQQAKQKGHKIFILSARYRKDEPTMIYVRRFLRKHLRSEFYHNLILVEKPEEKNIWLEKWQADIYIDDKPKYLKLITYPVKKYLYNSSFKYSQIKI